MGGRGGGGEVVEGGAHGAPAHHPVPAVVNGNTPHPLIAAGLKGEEKLSTSVMWV